MYRLQTVAFPSPVRILNQRPPAQCKKYPLTAALQFPLGHGKYDNQHDHAQDNLPERNVGSKSQKMKNQIQYNDDQVNAYQHNHKHGRWRDIGIHGSGNEGNLGN
jgi:hypothetical protein